MKTLRNTIHLICRFKTAKAFNLLGLIVAFIAFFLLMTQVIYHQTFNKGFTHYERIYRLENKGFLNKDEWDPWLCHAMIEVMDSVPQVECTSVGLIGGNMLIFKNGESEMKFPFVEGNNTVVSALTDHVVDGNIQWTDDDTTGVIIPASFAKRYFGDSHVANRKMTLVNGKSFTVRGVYEDFPENSDIKNYIVKRQRANRHKGDLGGFGYQCLVKVKEDADINQVAEAFRQRYADRILKAIESQSDTAEVNEYQSWIRNHRVNLRPITALHFIDDIPAYVMLNGESNNKEKLHILELACLLVLIVAAINFSNFTMAECPMRLRGLNTRQVFGASRQSIRTGIIAEGVAISLLACVIALGLCHIISNIPAFTQIFYGSISLVSHHWLVLLLIVTAIILGIIAGCFPAYYATSFPVATALKGSIGLTPEGVKLRTILVFLQLFISFLIAIYVGFLGQQYHYIFHSGYGYDRDQLLYFTFYDNDTTFNNEDILNAIDNLPEVESTALSMGSILGEQNGAAEQNLYNGKSIHFLYVGLNYLPTMGIKLTDGRDFCPIDHPDSCCILNDAACRQFNVKPGDYFMANGDTLRILGACENIRFGTTLNDNSKPLMFVLASYYPFFTYHVRVQPGADHEMIKREIINAISPITGFSSIDIKDFEQTLEKAYKNEFTYIRQVFLFAIICLIITIIGAFCLTLFECEYRRKEIGIRKITGATTGEVIKMLSRQYLALILISFVTAAPIACFLGWKWLKHFAERAPFNWWILPLALLLVGGVILGTVILKSWVTARENPVNSIKTE